MFKTEALDGFIAELEKIHTDIGAQLEAGKVKGAALKALSTADDLCNRMKSILPRARVQAVKVNKQLAAVKDSAKATAK